MPLAESVLVLLAGVVMRYDATHCEHIARAVHRRGLQRNNTSGYKGVSERLTRRGETVYVATITVESRNMCLGYFDSARAAALADDRAARRYFGAEAMTNQEMGLL